MKKKRLYLPVLLAAFTLMTAFSGCGSDKKSHIVKQASDLAGAKIGVQVGTTGDAYVTENYEKKKGTDIQRYDKGADAVQALKQGKIDTVVIDDQVAKAFAEKNPELSILDEDLVVEQRHRPAAPPHFRLATTFFRILKRQESTLPASEN